MLAGVSHVAMSWYREARSIFRRLLSWSFSGVDMVRKEYLMWEVRERRK